MGYGDIIPSPVPGRIAGGAVMVMGIASVTTTTAVMACLFSPAVRRRREGREEGDSMRAELMAINSRLDEVGRRTGELRAPATDAPPPPGRAAGRAMTARGRPAAAGVVPSTGFRSRHPAEKESECRA